METLVGSASSRCELGETLVAYRAGDQMFSVLGPSRDMVQLVDEEFEHYRQGLEFELSQLDRQQLTQTTQGKCFLGRSSPTGQAVSGDASGLGSADYQF